MKINLEIITEKDIKDLDFVLFAISNYIRINNVTINKEELVDCKNCGKIKFKIEKLLNKKKSKKAFQTASEVR